TTRFTRTRHSDIVHPVSSSQLTETRDHVRSFGGYNSGPTLAALAAGGTRLIALRSAGFNNVDLASAEKLKMTVMRVPAYSPEAVAEHAVALMLALNRNIHHAYNRVREGNFDLKGLVGFNIAGKTVGIEAPARSELRWHIS